MASDAATATFHTFITTAPAIALTVVTLGYAWLCWMRPFKRCRRCTGQGHTVTRFLRRHRTCRGCAGEGWHLRAGRRAYNHMRRLNHAAQAAPRTAAREAVPATHVFRPTHRNPGGSK